MADGGPEQNAIALEDSDLSAAAKGGRLSRVSDVAARPHQFVPTLMAGLVVGAVEVIIVTSFAALVFSGPLSSFLPAALALNLVGAAVLMTVIAGMGSWPGSVGSLQDATAVIVASIVASIVAGRGGQDAFLLAVLAIVVSSAAIGIACFLLGRFRLGHLVRFVPYPVVGGFLAGTGWLLAKGGLNLLTDVSVSLGTVPELLRPHMLVRWLPGIGFAVLLLVATRRVRHVMLIPGAMVAATAAFYLVLPLVGSSMSEARSGGFLLGPFPQSEQWRAWTLTAVREADWSPVLGAAPTVLTVVVVGVLALLLNVSATEIATQKNLDLNRELRAAGVANLAGAIAGGMPGYHAVSLTMLGRELGAKGRLVALGAAGVCAATALVGATLLAALPRAVIAGLLVFLGLGFLAEWVYDSARRLPRSEFVLLVLIAAVVALVGPLQGVAVGLIIALALFAARYSRTGAVRHVLTAATFHSNVQRTPAQLRALEELGPRVHVVELQGFLFFGTATTLLDQLGERLDGRAVPPVRFLALDFHRVVGMDSSAVMSFVRIERMADTHGATLVLTGLRDELEWSLRVGGMALDTDSVRVFVDLDHGMEWCEDQLLDTVGIRDGAGPSSADVLVQLLREPTYRPRLLAYARRRTLPAGQRLIRQGDVADEIYVLEEGRLSAVLEWEADAPVRLRSMGPGAVVGELSVYTGKERSASIVTDVPCTVLELRHEDFERMERHDPDLAAALHRSFATTLAYRLEYSLRTIRALLD